ncbi:MAG: hypothetical protein OSB38_36500 [Paraburkholderia fungorum]|nr:hypothetical protein [Paraburkholderia fungorum]
MEDDRCIMKIGDLRAHFTGYQPEKRATQEFCEDIPELGRAIIVIDFVSNSLRDQQVEFRVLKDVKGLKSRGRFEDLGSSTEIDSATVMRVAPHTYPRGTLTFEHDFEQSGWYIGMLTAKNPITGQELHSVFPFMVGMSRAWKYARAFIAVLALAGLAYWLSGRRKSVGAR